MNIRDLQYLVALKEHQHFGKAAEASFVSQPALSMQLKKLEEVLGVQLLERSNKSVMFTDIGNVIAEKSREILQQVHELKDLAYQAADPFAGEMHLGLFPTLAPYFLPKMHTMLQEQFPNLTLYLHEEKTSVLLEKLRQGKIDAALLAASSVENGLAMQSLFVEEFKLAVPQQHALAKEKVLKQCDLQDQKLLLLEEGHCLREQALSFCFGARALENQHFRATSLETLRHMVAAGVGMTLMPALACRKTPGIAYIPFSDPKPHRNISLVWRSTSAKQRLMQVFSTKIKEEVNNAKDAFTKAHIDLI